MNKDFELKGTQHYSSAHLRARINEQLKQVHDPAEELTQPLAKTLPVIPVTGRGKLAKYFSNKSPKGY